jgi:murein endopeptidase
VSELLIKPNPKGSSSPQVQKDAEAEKVRPTLARQRQLQLRLKCVPGSLHCTLVKRWHLWQQQQ